MPVIYVDGSPYSLSEDQFNQGQYPANANLAVLSKDGTVGTMSLDKVRPHEARQMLSDSQAEMAAEETVQSHVSQWQKEKALEEEFSGVGAGAKAFGLGAAQAVTFGGAGALLDMTGLVSKEYQKELETRQRAANIAGEVAASLIPLGGGVNAISKAARFLGGAPRALHAATYGKIAKEGAGFGRKAAAAAAEGAAYSTARTIGDMARDREDFEVESAASDLLKSAVFGAGVGASLQGIGSAAAKGADWVSQKKVPVLSWVVDKLAQAGTLLNAGRLGNAEIGAARQMAEDIAAAGGPKAYQQALVGESKAATAAAKAEKAAIEAGSLAEKVASAKEDIVYKQQLAHEKRNISRGIMAGVKDEQRTVKKALEMRNREVQSAVDEAAGLEAELKALNKPFSNVEGGKAAAIDRYVDSIGKDQDAIQVATSVRDEIRAAWEEASVAGIGKAQKVRAKVSHMLKFLNNMIDSAPDAKTVYKGLDNVVKDFDNTFSRPKMRTMESADVEASKIIRGSAIDNAKVHLTNGEIFGSMGSKNKVAREAWSEYYRVEESFKQFLGKKKLDRNAVMRAVKSDNEEVFNAVTSYLMAKKDAARKIANAFPEGNTSDLLGKITARIDKVLEHINTAKGAHATRIAHAEAVAKLKQQADLMGDNARAMLIDKAAQRALDRSAAKAKRVLENRQKAAEIDLAKTGKVDAVKAKQDFLGKVTGRGQEEVLGAGGRIVAQQVSNVLPPFVANMVKMVSSPYAVYRAGMATSNAVKRMANGIDSLVGKGGGGRLLASSVDDKSQDVDSIMQRIGVLSSNPDWIDKMAMDQIADAQVAGIVSKRTKQLLQKIQGMDYGKKNYLVNQLTGASKKMSQPQRMKVLKMINALTDPASELSKADYETMQMIMTEYPATHEIFQSATMQALPDSTSFGARRQLGVSRSTGTIASEAADPAFIAGFQAQMAPMAPQVPQEKAAEGRRVNDASAKRISSANQQGQTLTDRIMAGAYA